MARIVDGLRAGTIAPPVGSPAGWMPPGYEDSRDRTTDGDATPPGSDGQPPADSGNDAAPADDAQPPAADVDPDTLAPGETPDDDAPPLDGDAVEPGADVADPAPGQPVRDAWLAVAQSIDPTLDDARFDAWWDRGGDNDDARAERMADILWRTRFGEARPDDLDAASARDRLVEAIDAGGTRGTLVALDALGSEELARLAREDPGILAALEAFDTHAFATLDGDHGAEGRFDPVTGEERVSDAWIDDRARHLAWRLAADAGTDLASVEGDGWRFVDRGGAAEETLVLGDAGPVEQQVVFARDGGDRIAGLEGTDRLHGGDGDDVLGGGGGDDLVEGADGDDRLNGGRGDDALAGGRGDDDLVGGRGRDRLDGGAGDDLLDGGRGDDRLEGGAGHDTYVFAGGDGDDVVVDADGRGEIVLDGVRLTGARAWRRCADLRTHRRRRRRDDARDPRRRRGRREHDPHRGVDLGRPRHRARRVHVRAGGGRGGRGRRHRCTGVRPRAHAGPDRVRARDGQRVGHGRRRRDGRCCRGCRRASAPARRERRGRRGRRHARRRRLGGSRRSTPPCRSFRPRCPPMRTR